MSGWIAGAVVVGAVAGAYASSEASSEASKSADKATAAGVAASDAQLQFNREQQARWDEIFGPTQDVLSEYYNNLDPNDVAATNVTAMQQAYQNTQQQLDKQLAQRGIGDSGLAASMGQNLMYQNEMGKAEARVLAPQQVAQQQTNFLGLGMGQGGALQAGMNSAFSNQINMASNSYNAAMNQQTQANASLSSSIGAAGSALGYFAGTPSQQHYDTQAGFVGPRRS